jgi:hypothetical protein
MSSGEGLPWPIRDEIYKMEKGEEVLADPGAGDKRLFVDEREFSQALDVMHRHGNTISRVVRDLWDCREHVGHLTKHDQVKVSNPYVTICGQITIKEIKEKMSTTAIANGYANRLLFVLVRRARMLPFGGEELEESKIVEMQQALRDGVQFAQGLQRVEFDAKVKAAWQDIYGALSSEGETLLDEVAARAEAQVIRLALIYAVINRSSVIETEHLEAAVAVWNYCKASAGYIFGKATGTALADDLYEKLASEMANTAPHAKSMAGRLIVAFAGLVSLRISSAARSAPDAPRSGPSCVRNGGRDLVRNERWSCTHPNSCICLVWLLNSERVWPSTDLLHPCPGLRNCHW